MSAAIVPGDTISGESLDLPGDIDEFTYSGTVGEELNAFIQAQSGSLETFRLEVVDAAGTVQRGAQSVATDTSLLRQPTGRFALTSTGTYRLRVRGASDFSDHARGPYRLFVHRVNRAPESVPATLAFGDSVSGETIAVPGDVDEFRVTVPDSSGANLVVELVNAIDGGPLVQLIDSASRQVIVAGGAPASGQGALGRVRLGPGTYIVRVDGDPNDYGASTMRGGYRIWFYRFGFGPEVAADTFAIGDTVSGESIAPWGDADNFRFHGLRGQHINVALQGFGNTLGGGFQAWISGPGGEPYWTFASVASGTSDLTLRDHQTMRLDLPVTGWYHVEMTGFGSTRGEYRLLVEPLGTAPEEGAAALGLGDSVTESLAPPSDWDEFTVTATPGQEVNVIFQANPAMNGYAQIRVRDRATGDSLAGNVGQGTRVVGPFRMPTSGQVTIAVYQDAGFVRFCYDATCGGIFGLAGPYAFRVDPLNRGPEAVPAAYTVGDTVRGEAIDAVGDLDEFTTSATPGVNLSVNARLLATPVPAGGIIWLDVLDPATGTVLSTGSGLIGGSPTSPFYGLASVAVPASGSVLFRFRGYSYWGDELATAPYEFFVQR